MKAAASTTSSAPEHRPSDVPDTPLPELVGGSAGIGRWTLKVCGPPTDKEYTYQWNGKPQRGKAFTVLLVSEDSTQYCYGKFMRRGKEPQATTNYNQAKEKFKDGTTWSVTKVTLAKEKPLYIGSSVKAVIDLNATTTAPVLQSTRFATLEPTPAEELAALLEAPAWQRVDVTALVVKVSAERTHTTSVGPRLIVDVTIRDASGTTGASECEFTMFFPGSQAGKTELDEFRRCHVEGTPVAFFNCCIHNEEGGVNTLKPVRDDFKWKPSRMGERAAALIEQAKVLQSTDTATRIASIPEFQHHEATDYLTPEATLTVTRLLKEIIRAPEDFPSESQTHLFQLNHVRILEPSAGENVLTTDGGRLFPAVTMQDHTGQVEMRMREKAALELGGMDKDDFLREVANGGLNFPVLASVRVNIRKTTSSCATEQTAENAVSAIIVEATEQPLHFPKAFPNASMNFVNDLLKSLGIRAPDRMIVAPANTVKHSPHGGLIVQEDNDTRYTCASVLTLIAHVGKSKVSDLPTGHRISSAESWNIPFQEVQVDGAPEHADMKLNCEIISYCTMENVQYFTLSSRKGREPTYAMVVLGSSHISNKVTNFMANKVQTIAPTDLISVRKAFDKLWLLSKKAGEESGTPGSQKREWTGMTTPYHAKKARQLCWTPTDGSM